MPESERRDCARRLLRVDALVSAGPEEGGAALAELSYSGALVEDCSLHLPVGTQARLYLYAEGLPSLELEGQVSRHTETGFALRYELHDAVRRALVDRVTERLATGRQD